MDKKTRVLRSRYVMAGVMGAAVLAAVAVAEQATAPHDPTDDYGRHWHGAFAVCATGLSDGTSSSTDFSGGDFFAIREDADGGEPVVFLSHDGGYENGRVLARSFTDFLLRWSAIGCVGGASGWAFEYFLGDDGLDPDGEVATRFRELLGVMVV